MGKWCRRIFQIFAVCCLFLSVLSPARAFEPLEPANTSSPRATLSSFLFHMNSAYDIIRGTGLLAVHSSSSPLQMKIPEELVRRGEFHLERAVQCFDLTKIPLIYRTEKGYESALQMKEILDRTGLPPADEIPGAGFDPSDRGNSPPRWTLPGTEIQLYRIQEGERQGQWLFTPETVARLEEDYHTVRSFPYLPGSSEGFYNYYSLTPGRLFPPFWMKYLPSWTSAEFFDQTLWQWAALFLSLSLFIAGAVLLWNFCRKVRVNRTDVFRQFLAILPPLAIYALSGGMIYLFDETINITGSPALFLLGTMTFVEWTAAAWAILRVGEFAAEVIILSPNIIPQGIDASLIRTTSRLISLFAATATILYGASQLGLSIVPLLTGLGVVGLAISLAAKPTVENIIGGLSLFADRTVRVGEFCRFGNTAGTVTHIGLRSTRVEAMDHTIISIPNAEFSQMQLVNVTRREKSLLQKTVTLRYETTPDQLRWILASLREMLHGHPKVCAVPPPFARFEGLGESALEILLFAYIATKKWADFLAVQEDILFRVADIVEKGGSGFAFPSTTAYIAKDKGIDEEKGAEAERKVDLWRKDDFFPFPETPSGRIAALRGSQEYPFRKTEKES